MRPLALLILLITTCLQALAVSPNNTTVAYWRLTSNLLDSSGNGLNGVPIGRGVFQSSGLSCNGVDDRVFIADNPLFALTQSITLEATIQIQGLPGGQFAHQIVFRGDDRGGLDPYYLAVTNDGRLLFHISKQQNQISEVMSPSPLPQGQTIHVAGTLDATTGLQQVYVNGQQVAYLYTGIRPFGTLDSTSNPGLGICNVQSANYQEYFQGIVQDVRISNAALPPTQFLPQSGELSFAQMTPCRLVDTRGSGFSGAFGPPYMAANTTRTFPLLASGCGVPVSALAYSLNITVVPHGPLTYLSIWPAGLPQPVVSTLNALDGRVVANAAIVPAGTDGAINIYASNDTDVIVDIDGYFGAAISNGLSLYTVTPCRVADTRGNGFNGALGPPFLPGNSTRTFSPLASGCGVPVSALAYSLNITVVPHGPLTYLSIWPAGLPQPVVSTLNALDGRIVANAAIVPAGTSGAFDVYASNDTDVIVDINGYFGPPGASGGLSFYTVAPCRVADTRAGGNFIGAFGPPSIGATTTRVFPLGSSSCVLPAAPAYSLNVTAVPSVPLAYLSIWPTGESQPYVSTLNAPTGAVVPNAAIVPSGPGGSVSIYVTNLTDLLIDVNGYFAQ